MKSLFLAWQAPKDSDRSRAWFPSGDWMRKPKVRKWFPAVSAIRAEQREPMRRWVSSRLVSFPEFQENYTSEKLFPLFHNRVLSPKRADFQEYIEWLGLSREEADPISILSVSGGTRVTDNLQTFPKIEANADGSFQMRFFAHGLRHLTEASRDRAKLLTPGEKLRVMIEVNNPATRLAVTLPRMIT